MKVKLCLVLHTFLTSATSDGEYKSR